jgi:Fe2+ or Zn2+ uptake regulation protein
MARQNENLPSAEEQLKRAIAAVRRHETVYKKLDYWKKQKVIAMHDFIDDPNDNLKLLVLRGCDGGVQHAVALVGRTIFDSNLKKGLKLSKELLDWCCNCSGGLE